MFGAAPGSHVTLDIEGISRSVDARVAVIEEQSTRLQLPLNHEHIAFMREELAGRSIAEAA